jgi:FixJ family two-component response regulator
MPRRAYSCGIEQALVVFVAHRDFSLLASLQRVALDAWRIAPVQPAWRIESFGDAASFLSRLPAAGPACAILDTDLPDMDGLSLQSLLAHRHDIPVIFVADSPSVLTVVKAMKAGALDVFTTPVDEHSLLGAIRQALQRSSTLQMRDAKRRAFEWRYELLSPREREVMRFVIRGSLNKHIAAEMGITEFTVKAHRAKVMRKMQAASVPHLVAMAAALRIAPDGRTEEPTAWAISASAAWMPGNPSLSEGVSASMA